MTAFIMKSLAHARPVTTLQGQPNSGALVAFVALQVLGANILLPFLVLTFLVTRARRHPALINLCITFIITGVTLLLLFYAGQYVPGGPNRTLCVAQASLAWAVAPMDGAAVLCLLYTVWKSFDDASQTEKQHLSLAIRNAVLTIVPYVVFVGYAVGGTVVALVHPENVSLSPDVVFFCSIGSGVYTTSTSIGLAIFLLASVYVEVRIGIKLLPRLRNRQLVGPTIDMGFVPRVFIFGAYLCLSVVFTIASIVHPSLAPDIFAATLPVFFGLLFGSQRDIWEAWTALFSRKREAPKTVV